MRLPGLGRLLRRRRERARAERAYRLLAGVVGSRARRERPHSSSTA
ncbi:MAG TPA: hypothetical protein VNJ53_00160 [Gaiellaceae bacterium]|nr:hypothetical protein [Gaiellaceae bacterium]